jgi:hypothetical protein
LYFDDDDNSNIVLMPVSEKSYPHQASFSFARIRFPDKMAAIGIHIRTLATIHTFRNIQALKENDARISETDLIAEVHTILRFAEKCHQTGGQYPEFPSDVASVFNLLRSIDTFPVAFGLDLQILDCFLQFLRDFSSALLNPSLGLISLILHRSTDALRAFNETDTNILLLELFHSSDSLPETRELILGLVSEIVASENKSIEFFHSSLLDLALFPQPYGISLIPSQLNVMRVFVSAQPPEIISEFANMIFARALEIWNDATLVMYAHHAVDVFAALCEKGQTDLIMTDLDFATLKFRLCESTFEHCKSSIARLSAIIVPLNPAFLSFFPFDPIFAWLDTVISWTPDYDEFLLLFTTIAQIGRVWALLKPGYQDVLLKLNFEQNWHVRELVLRMLWIGFINIESIQEQAALMNADVFVAMVCPDDTWEPLLAPIMIALRRVGESAETGNLNAHALNSVFEFLELVSESEDPEIAEAARKFCAQRASTGLIVKNIPLYLSAKHPPFTDYLPLIAPAGFVSLIVANFPALFAEFRGKRLSLLWRGSRDDFSARDFHGRGDGHAATLVLIQETKGNIFGYFTPVKWESARKKSKADPSLKSFLSTLKNPHNFPARKFALRAEEKDKAIWCDSLRGPILCDSSAVHLNLLSR